MPTPTTSPDTIVLTAALPYGNGPLHAGHAIEYVMADIIARNYRRQGKTCHYICADDSHGAAVQMLAEDRGIDPEEIVTEMRNSHFVDFSNLGIKFSLYGSTHIPQNQALVYDAYEAWKEYGCLFVEERDQFYDETEGRPLPDRYVIGNCPRCGAEDQYGDSCSKCGATYDALELINPRATRTGQTPVVKTSQHIFFEMNSFADMLQEWGARIGLQSTIVNKLAEWFDEGLKPWCLSRDAPYFGFEIPDRPGQYFYVWVDAPMGYLANFKQYCDENDLDFEAILASPNTRLEHIIGKDIANFHCVYWPAMLYAAGRRLPDSVHCHGFLTVNGEKMSKSRGTQISLSRLLETVDADAYRFFVYAHLNDTQDDIDLNLEGFVDRINSDLVGKIVNIASRSAAVLDKLSKGHFAPKIADEQRFDDYLETIGEAIELTGQKRFSAACRIIVGLADTTNKWLTEHAPWALAKGDEVQREQAIAICTQALIEFRALMIALAPVTPNLSARAFELYRVGKKAADTDLDSLDPRRGLGRWHLQPFVPLLQRLDRKAVLGLIEPVSDEEDLS